MYLKIQDPNPSLPARYQTRVEVNLKEEQKSIEMMISYNYDYKRAFIEIRDNNTINKLIFSFDTDEIYSITCIKFIFNNYELILL